MKRRGKGRDEAVSVKMAIWRRNLRWANSINSDIVYADWFMTAADELTISSWLKPASVSWLLERFFSLEIIFSTAAG